MLKVLFMSKRSIAALSAMALFAFVAVYSTARDKSDSKADDSQQNWQATTSASEQAAQLLDPHPEYSLRQAAKQEGNSRTELRALASKSHLLKGEALASLVSGALTSDDPLVMRAASDAIVGCMRVAANFRSHEGPALEYARSEIHHAGQELRARCRVLAANPVSVLSKNARELHSRLAGLSTAEAPGYFSSSRADDDSKGRAMTRLGNEIKNTGRDKIYDYHADLAAHISELASDGQMATKLSTAFYHKEGVIHAAAVIALCQASTLCDSNSLVYLNRCTFDGVCGGSIENGLKSQLSEGDFNNAKLMAIELLKAIDQGDLRALGLVSTP